MNFPSAVVCAAFACSAIFVSGCGEQKSVARSRVGEVGAVLLRKESARLNRDFFAVPGVQFTTLKASAWPKSFAAVKPKRVTLYRDGAAIALGGDSGSTEWGVFVVPTGLQYIPPATKTIRYEALEEGVLFYQNVP
jgi:hypothetical protein